MSIVPFLAAVAGCLPHVQRVGYDDLARSEPPPPAAAAPPAADEEAGLEKEARLESILKIALARNPGLREADERVREKLERVPAAARLPDLELKYEQWGVPLTRPYALNEAQTLMLGLRQTFPAAGSLDAKGDAAVEDARITLASARVRQRDIVRQVRHAYHDFALGDREYRIHLEHVQLTEQILEATRSSFRVGAASEQDVLRVGVELASLHRDVVAIEQRRRSAQALLNALMARAPDAPLGPPPELPPTEIREAPADLAKLARQDRPEILAAAHEVKRGQAEIDAARREAAWPSLMVGLDYWLMPTLDEPHAYGAMVSINLPWLNPAHREELRAAEHARAADERALESMQINVGYEVADAYGRYQAARASYLLVRDDLMPAARQSFEAARAAFSAGRGSALGLLDALRSLLDVRLDEVRARVDLANAIADLDRAVGADLEEVALGNGAKEPGHERH